MSYLIPSEFVTKMIDAGESKVFMSTRDTVIRAYMAGAILALAAVFAVTVTVQTGYAIIGAILFPVGFCMLYLLGFDLVARRSIKIFMGPWSQRNRSSRPRALRSPWPMALAVVRLAKSPVSLRCGVFLKTTIAPPNLGR